MSFSSGFHNSKLEDRVYSAEQFSSMFDRIITDGVFENVQIGGSLNNNDRFYVESIGGMNIRIGRGKAWLYHTWNVNDAKRTVGLRGSHGVFSRYDAVVIEVNRKDRVNSIKIVEGKFAPTAKKPELVYTDEIHQYPIAYIFIHYGVSSISQENIEYVVGTKALPYAKSITENLDPIRYIADNLTTTKEGYILSAKQGKILKDLIIALDYSINSAVSNTSSKIETDMNGVSSKLETDMNGVSSKFNSDKTSASTKLNSDIAAVNEKLNTDYKVPDVLYDSNNNAVLDSSGDQVHVIGKYLPSSFSDAMHFADLKLENMKESLSSAVVNKLNQAYITIMDKLDNFDVRNAINNKLGALYSKLNSFLSKVNNLLINLERINTNHHTIDEKHYTINAKHYLIDSEIKTIGLDEDAGDATKYLPLQPISTFLTNALNSMRNAVSQYTAADTKLNGLGFGYNDDLKRYGYFDSNGKFAYFKSGKVYYLGNTKNQTEFDINGYPNKNSYTDANFLCIPTSISISVSSAEAITDNAKSDKESESGTNWDKTYFMGSSAQAKIDAISSTSIDYPRIVYNRNTRKLNISQLTSSLVSSGSLHAIAFGRTICDYWYTDASYVGHEELYYIDSKEQQIYDETSDITVSYTVAFDVYLID